MRVHETFNHSGFSRFINNPAGRIFRLGAGAGFLALGWANRSHPLGVISMLWSVLPLSAGAFDLCFISALLGGPISGARIREAQHREPPIEGAGGVAAPHRHESAH